MTQTAPATSAVAYASAASAPRAGVGLEPDVTGFYDEATGSVQYVVADPMTRRCAVIDPVLDFDPTSGAWGSRSKSLKPTSSSKSWICRESAG
jgi:hypothetical protein